MIATSCRFYKKCPDRGNLQVFTALEERDSASESSDPAPPTDILRNPDSRLLLDLWDHLICRKAGFPHGIVEAD